MSLDELKDPNRVIGSKQVKKAVTSGIARKVFVAGDAEPHILDSIVGQCRQSQIEYEIVETMKLLGDACGIEVGSATAALLYD
ncbi:MAG: 50S ribosomal protein L7ae-like protein [Syntrophomonadaceae bacterium]|nr:50S ribosomal protein L7ae-like protein [Syntrophomonadaceae bacterium]